jgi:chromosome segregation ATPase
MLRRRRPLKGEAIHFSFDSFLDLVTNVVGIIIRLILAAWIGARSYHASMQFLDNQPESPTKATATTIVDDPLQHRIDLSKRDLDDAKTLLLARLKELEAGEQKTVSTEAELATLVKRREELGAELRSLESKGSQGDGKVRQASLSVDQVRQRSKKLLDDIKKLEETPSNMKQLKYHAPVSRAVRSDELFFECKNGRVTYIDLPSFLQEYKTSLEECAQELKTKWQVERRTAPVGP